MAAAMPSSSRRRNSAGAVPVSGLAASGCAVLTVVTLSLLGPQACRSWYSDVPSIWYVRVPSTGGAHEHRDTAGWPIAPALRARRHRAGRSAVDDAPDARA